MVKKQQPTKPFETPTPGRTPETPAEEITEIPLQPEEELDIIPEEEEPVIEEPFVKPPPGEGP